MKYIIGITQRLATQEEYQERREILACDWGRFFEQNGILPIPLSYAINIQEYAPFLNGIILSGGNDLGIFNSSKDSKQRDQYEMEVIDYCCQCNIPLLGICRGAQMIAHYFGSKFSKTNCHVGEHDLMWNQIERVNSYHHYKIVELGDALESLAEAKDRSIEAFCHKEFSIFGAMWHIERENEATCSTKKILNLFFGDFK